MHVDDDKVNGVLLFADRLLQEEIANKMVKSLENADRSTIFDSRNEIGVTTFPESLEGYELPRSFLL